MTNTKKRDKKNRLLREGESQLKDGRYMYRYTNKQGERKCVYSWRLVETDETPPGKANDSSLREKEAEIEKDSLDRINTKGSDLTLNELFERYIRTKRKLEPNTKDHYTSLYNSHVRDTYVGSMKIKDLSKCDILEIYDGMADDDMSNGTIHCIQNVIFPAFEFAMDNDWIRKNPSKNCTKEYPYDVMNRRSALTIDQQNNFVEFMENDKVYGKYVYVVKLMLQTALRRGEALGLTWDDINFDSKIIDVNHQLHYRSVKGKYCFKIGKPKKSEGRQIPMTNETYRLLKSIREKEYFNSVGLKLKIDGFSNFVFLNMHKNNVIIPRQFGDALVAATNKYNKREVKMAEKENRNVEFMPMITPHVLRHTACTRMAEAGIDVKVLQSIMGHKKVETTMNIYNHAAEDLAHCAKEIEKVDIYMNGR